MSDQDPFQSDDQDPGSQSDNDLANQDQDTSNQDPFADQLGTILNEDGTPKYSDVASALSSIPHAQTHINTLETDNATLKEQLGAANAAKELLAKQLGKQEPTQAPGLTAEQVVAIARQTQDETTQANREESNVNSVRAKFSELYGAKAVEQMKLVAGQAGMSVAAVKKLAKTSPQAVFRLAGITVNTQKQDPPKTPGAGAGDNFTPERKTETPKSVMGGSNTKDLVANWKAAGEIVAQNQ